MAPTPLAVPWVSLPVQETAAEDETAPVQETLSEEQTEQQTQAVIQHFVDSRFDRDGFFGGAQPPISETSDTESETASLLAPDIESDKASLSASFSASYSSFAASSHASSTYSASPDAISVNSFERSFQDSKATNMARLLSNMTDLADSIDRTHGSRIRDCIHDIRRISSSTGRTARELFHESSTSLLSDGVSGGRIMQTMLSGYELGRQEVRDHILAGGDGSWSDNVRLGRSMGMYHHVWVCPSVGSKC